VYVYVCVYMVKGGWVSHGKRHVLDKC
jgi:hypothetical protein